MPGKMFQHVNGFHVCELMACKLIRIYISLCVRLIYERLVLSLKRLCDGKNVKC